LRNVRHIFVFKAPSDLSAASTRCRPSRGKGPDFLAVGVAERHVVVPVIGEIFDKVFYALGGSTAAALKGIQFDRQRPPLQGPSSITDSKHDVRASNTLVDHNPARAERGLLGISKRRSSPNPDVYNGHVMRRV